MPLQRYRAPVRMKANASEFALYTFAIGKNNYYNKSASETVRLLKVYINKLSSDLETAITFHSDLLAIRSESFGLVAASDFMAGAKLPPLTMWDPIKSQIITLKSARLFDNIPNALQTLRYASFKYEETYQKLTLYYRKNQKGYDGAIETLSFIKGGAEMAIGAYNPLIGGAYTAGLKVITQAVELQYDMRDKIDWEGIAIELIIDELFSLALDKISGKILEKLPAVQLHLPFSLKDKVANLLLMAPNVSKKILIKGLINKLGDVISESLKTAINQKRNSQQQLSWEIVINTATEQFSRKEIMLTLLEEILGASMENASLP